MFKIFLVLMDESKQFVCEFNNKQDCLDFISNQPIENIYSIEYINGSLTTVVS